VTDLPAISGWGLLCMLWRACLRKCRCVNFIAALLLLPVCTVCIAHQRCVKSISEAPPGNSHLQNQGVLKEKLPRPGSGRPLPHRRTSSSPPPRTRRGTHRNPTVYCTAMPGLPHSRSPLTTHIHTLRLTNTHMSKLLVSAGERAAVLEQA